MISTATSRILKGLAILVVIASHYAEWMFMAPAHPGLAHAISTWGPAGVDVFFLFSGYGLYKSATKGSGSSGEKSATKGSGARGKNSSGIDAFFVWKRFLAVYLPYLLVSFGIEWYCGSWKTADGNMVFRFFTAADYWYMNVLFVMYIAFMICFRFCGRLRIPVLSAVLIAHFVWLVRTGHSDFWTLSNAAFLLGILAAAVERKWDLFKGLRNRLILLAVGLAGSVACFYWMQACGGSGKEGAYAAELVQNIFISLAVLGAAYLIPGWKSPLLAPLGDASLFIYLLHVVIFYAMMNAVTISNYFWANVGVAVFTLLFAEKLSELYGLVSGKLRGPGPGPKSGNGPGPKSGSGPGPGQNRDIYSKSCT